MKQDTVAMQSTSLSAGHANGAESLLVSYPQATTEVKVDGQTPLESAKKKKVQFVLRNNLICKPHAPLPPLSMRTPPSATPRGSAFKSGVLLPGPIRTRPIHIHKEAKLLILDDTMNEKAKQLHEVLLDRDSGMGDGEAEQAECEQVKDKVKEPIMHMPYSLAAQAAPAMPIVAPAKAPAAPTVAPPPLAARRGAHVAPIDACNRGAQACPPIGAGASHGASEGQLGQVARNGRKRKECPGAGKSKCSNCGRLGHNRKTCGNRGQQPGLAQVLQKVENNCPTVTPNVVPKVVVPNGREMEAEREMVEILVTPQTPLLSQALNVPDYLISSDEDQPESLGKFGSTQNPQEPEWMPHNESNLVGIEEVQRFLELANEGAARVEALAFPLQ
ncbi:unnamed protein product [Calypogeia fissa]